MTDDVVIRPATEADLPALGRLGAHLVRIHHDWDPERFMAAGPKIEDGYAWFLGTQLAEKDVVILVAERRGQVLGYVYAGIEPRSWQELRDEAGFIHDVVVDETARGAGIGGLLVNAAADRLEELGAPRIVLVTAEKNIPGQHLFARLGFRRTMIEMTRERRKK